jgi:hypothetical protein
MIVFEDVAITMGGYDPGLILRSRQRRRLEG